MPLRVSPQPSQRDMLLRHPRPQPQQPHPLALLSTHLREFQPGSFPLQTLPGPYPPSAQVQEQLSSWDSPPVLSTLQRLYQPSRFQKLTEPQKLDQLADIMEYEYGISQVLESPQSAKYYSSPEQIEAIYRLRDNALSALLDKFVTRINAQPYEPQKRAHPFFMPQGSDGATQSHFLRHFKLHTSTSFNVDPQDRRHSDNILREIAIRHSFESTSLMNCVLAISALHIKQREIAGDPDLISRLADEYSHVATMQFLMDMEVADPESFPHLVIASLLMTAVSSRNFRDEDSIYDLFIVNWMKLWGGIGVMIERITVPGLISSGLSKLFYRPPVNPGAGYEHVPQSLKDLVELCSNAEGHAIYHETLRYLGALYHTLKDGLSPMMRLRIITWVTFIPKEFVELALERRWRALVIVAHYAVFMKLTTRVWWMENVGQRSIQDLVTALGPQRSSDIQVPIAAKDIDDPDQIGRLLLNDETWVHEPSTRAFTPEEMLYDSARDTFVDDKGRATIAENPDLVFNETMPGGVDVALWRSDLLGQQM
ncbi:Fungal transcriptional regulatory protein [Akanthomyces lecanii RCEF 1005]|uniref:Fungal transcriptional regulatory protein n=1 Tax=Akanthomyces lecanii RCEF 1005 TaxID=1081108 RepID=A0A168GC99_CORDF|nr:Fungal transcriptional regulatory protein [Akanthomyces lecanii RCEF 1005]